MNKIYKYEDFISENENIAIVKSISEKDESRHTHEFVELVYMLSGEAEHYINDISYSTKKGDLLFINYNEEHSFFVKDSIVIYVNIMIKPAFFGSELINSENIYDVFSTFLWDGFNENFDSDKRLISRFFEIGDIIENMLDEFEAKKAGYKSILNGYMRVIFARIIREMQASDSGYISKIAPEILNYINENCLGKISLTEIAQKSFYNPTYFSRIFKEYCGQSLSTYIQKKRIEEAIKLLKSTNLTVDKICEAVGYSEKKQFYKLFKEHTGLTPNNFRKTPNG